MEKRKEEGFELWHTDFVIAIDAYASMQVEYESRREAKPADTHLERATQVTTDRYNAISAAIVAAINSGNLGAWRKPWRAMAERGDATVPVNALTGKAYRGLNVFLLWSRLDADLRYVTYRQAGELGGHVKRGEKGTQIIFWKKSTYKARDAATGEEETRNSLLMRTYTVFNVAQCEGLKLKAREVPVHVAPPANMAEVYAQVGAEVRHQGNEAYYSPGPDMVTMPAADQFTSADMYAATALHELTHWTGHKARLDRDFSGRFGTQAYAAEELVAEFGAAFLCAALGVDGGLEAHASYIAHWQKLVKEDPKALITAASKAQAAADLILAKVRPVATADDAEEELAEAA